MIPADLPWRRGMRLTATCDGQPVAGTYVTAGYVWLDDVAPFGEWDHDRAVAFEMLVNPQPDPTDGATRGAFLDAVREAYEDPTLCAIYDHEARVWNVGRWEDHGLALRGRGGPTEWDAIAAAWGARPGAS